MPGQAELLELSVKIEARLVAGNQRGMQGLRAALRPGYILRASRMLAAARGTALIGTGFPVAGSFETDGPVGAIVLYNQLKLRAKPILACAPPLYTALAPDYDCLELPLTTDTKDTSFAVKTLARLDPCIILSIERPGLTEDGRYLNMRGEDIGHGCAVFDHFMDLAHCPTIGIGDGGNEIGMGNLGGLIRELGSQPAATECDELLVADVSNWASYGILAMLSAFDGKDYLADVDPLAILRYLSARGSVDGVSRQNSLSEDGLDYTVGLGLIADLRAMLA